MEQRKTNHLSFKLMITLLALFSTHLCFSQKQEKIKLIYEWAAPNLIQKYPAVIVIGGSEGGLKYGNYWAELLNNKGFGVMSLAYFGLDGLSNELEEIPMEYFENALDTLLSKKGVDTNRIAVISISKGTEPALWLASMHSEISLVVAASPSNLIWQSISKDGYSIPKSSWTKNGKPLPFIEYDYSKGYYPFINLYKCALEKEIDTSAYIPVENAKATIILLSGDKDNIWPSSYMANELVNRLKKKNYSYPVIFKTFTGAGHGFLIPYGTEEKKTSLIKDNIPQKIQYLGGNVNAFGTAMTESLIIVLKELDNLKNQ